MTAYRYEAVDAAGRKKRGTVEADTQRRARREIQASGLTPVSLSEAGEGSGLDIRLSRGPKQPSRKDIIAATRQLATLIDAAMPVEEALAAVAAQERGSPTARVLTAVRMRVVEGWRLSEALGEHPKSFPPLYRGIVAAGETSGTLGAVLGRLADMLERNRAITQKATTALIYPATIAVVAIGVVWALMTFVVPRMVEQFSDMGAQLPLLTRVVIGVSDFVRDFGLIVLIALVAAIIGFIVARRRPRPKLAMDRMLLRLPVIGPLARDLDAARFARTLSTLFASGAPLLDSLRSARRTVVNSHIDDRLGVTLTGVREGASLSASLRRAGVFPPMMASMVSAGERSGALPLMLEKTADQMEGGFEAATTLALRLLEPAVIVTLGLVVMVIVLAIMLPILQINTMTLG
ncbi:type II secretion system inner membrane protein GspF [Parvularcula oceani]|uniref:type II secretion system inner membrane protein GspF n=1 Tax=Parvularcula oceani TaxID=1247963 RepID=UPI0004E235D5|nr:type II secretion system inner membrane protein GspF [Parvularcula oceani]